MIRFRRLRRHLALFPLTAALALSALAVPRIQPEGRAWMQETTGPIASSKFVQISRFVGSVQVVTGAKTGGYILRLHSSQALEKDARRHFASFHFKSSRQGGGVTLQTAGSIDLSLRPELIVQIPAVTEALHVDTLAGKIQIHGKMHQLDLQTHAGDIEIDEVDALRAVTLGGAVYINKNAKDSFIRTGGGDIHFDGPSEGNLEIISLGGNIWLRDIARARVQSAGGNIEVGRCAGDFWARTAGGNIFLGDMGGAVTAESGGGNIRVSDSRGVVTASTALGNIELWKLQQGAHAHTGMGRVTVEFLGSRASMTDSEVVTSVGDIVLYFAGGVPANVHAVTGASPAHRIVNDFRDLRVSTGLAEFGPHSIVAEGPIHGGGPNLFVRTLVGQIELHTR